MWFQKKSEPQPEPVVVVKQLPNYPVSYPAGFCVKTHKGHFFINKDGKRYRIPTQRIVDSWAFPHIIETTEAALANYPVAVTKLGFRDGSLLDNIADGKLYLASEGKLRHVVSPDVLERLGMNVGDALIVSADEINVMKQGEEIY